MSYCYNVDIFFSCKLPKRLYRRNFTVRHVRSGINICQFRLQFRSVLFVIVQIRHIFHIQLSPSRAIHYYISLKRHDERHQIQLILSEHVTLVDVLYDVFIKMSFPLAKVIDLIIFMLIFPALIFENRSSKLS